MKSLSLKHISFREMSALGSAAVVAAMAYMYFSEALMLSTHKFVTDNAAGWPQPMDMHAVLFRFAFGSVILLIGLQIIYHIIIGILWRRDALEKRDERDRMVSLKAARLAYVTLMTGLVAVVWYLLKHDVSNFVAAQYAFMALFASEFIRYAATFVYYRLSV